MKAAVVHSSDQIPVYTDFEPPKASPGQHIVRVKAAALSHVTRALASGKHYSDSGGYPFVAGVDGVGILEDGQRVYFAKPPAPYGAMAEEVALSPKQYVLLPDDIDDVTAAALANPGMSGWMALRERAAFQSGETVLVNGATGSSGFLAVQIAQHFGAKRIIATGRNPQALQELQRFGVDQVISLVADEDEQRAAFETAFEGGVDVVLDYLWGAFAQMIIEASSKISNPADTLRFVQIGSMAGEKMTLSAAMLRSRANVLMGSGLGSIAPDRMVASVRDLLASAGKAGFRIETETVALSDVSIAWERDSGSRRLVFSI